MVVGNWPPLTKGPIALFFLSNDALKSLDERMPGDHYMVLFFAYCLLELLLFSTKKIIKKRLEGIESSLVQTINENFLNVHSVTLKVLTGLLWTLVIGFWYFYIFGDDNEKKLSATKKMIVFLVTVETIVQWLPFLRSQPLR